MFLTTGEINGTYAIQGIVNATVKRALLPEEVDQVDQYDDLYTAVKTKLIERAVAKDGDGLIMVRFVPSIVQTGPAPRYMVLHGYGTVVSLKPRLKH